MKELEKLINELKKIKGVKAIYLFGSYAKAEQLPLSDIDLCVIADKDIDEKVKSDITSNSSEKIDVSLFWDLPIMIRYKVLKEGKILFLRDERFLHLITTETLREYFDFQPVIERFGEVYFGDRKWIEKE